MTTALDAFPHIDASRQQCLTDEQAQFFRDNGLLLIRNVFRGRELARMQIETLSQVEEAAALRQTHVDYKYAPHELTGQEVPFRVEYVVDKRPACRALMGHPFILKSVEKLQTRDFIPTWDSMVFKLENAGKAILWHRDAGDECVTHWPIFNVDFYPDGSDLSNCVWGVLGSNRWPREKAAAKIAKLNEGGRFNTDEDCVPIPVNPGDVLFHDILALHGSPPAQSKLRRVIYYEFRPIPTEMEKGPHRPEYISVKQKLLLKCIEHRRNTPYLKGETPFEYRPSPQFAVKDFDAARIELASYRIPHSHYWRNTDYPTGA